MTTNSNQKLISQIKDLLSNHQYQIDVDAEENGIPIIFHANEKGVIHTNKGGSIFEDLFMLGAFANTREKISGCDHRKYQTDAAGLKRLESITDEAINLLSGNILALGEVLAKAELQNLSDFAIQTTAWVIFGLSELQKQIIYEHNEILDANECFSKLYKNPVEGGAA